MAVPIETILSSPVKTVLVQVCNPFGTDVVLELTKLVLESGQEILIDAEHDIAYLDIRRMDKGKLIAAVETDFADDTAWAMTLKEAIVNNLGN